MRPALIIMMVILMVLWSDRSLAQDTPVEPPLTLQVALTAYPASFDPLYVTTAEEINLTTALFAGLTRQDPETGELLPGLAESWEVSEDGLTWTFDLRDDVPLVAYNAESRMVEQVRMLTADDLVQTVQRLCSSQETGYYAVSVFAPRLAGCEAAQAADDGTLVEAEAADETTFILTLTGNYAYFPEMARMWTLRPVPEESLSDAVTDRIPPEDLLYSGPYVLAGASPEQITLVQNPHYPEELWGGGNIERIQFSIVPDVRVQLQQYRLNQLDSSPVPVSQVQTVREDVLTGREIREQLQQQVFYIGFAMDKPPFDDVHVRRAFAAMVDREAFLATVQPDAGVPIAHFTPPGLAHAPPRQADFDVGYDPAYVQDQLAQSEYASCEGMPPIVARAFTGGGAWLQYLADQVRTLPGCESLSFEIEEVAEVSVLQALLEPQTPGSERPHLFTLGWAPDYGDADSFATYLACSPVNVFGRTDCTDLDDLIQAARIESDPDSRTALYAEIEAAFFGEAGVFPLIPLYLRSSYVLVHLWYTGPFETDGQFGGLHYDAYALNEAMVREVRVLCTISGGPVNIRSGPGLNFEIVDELQPETPRFAVAQTTGTDGFVWWRLESGDWVRNDVVEESGRCTQLPRIEVSPE